MLAIALDHLFLPLFIERFIRIFFPETLETISKNLMLPIGLSLCYFIYRRKIKTIEKSADDKVETSHI